MARSKPGRPASVVTTDGDSSGLSESVLSELERVAEGLSDVTARIAERVDTLTASDQ